MFMSDLNVAACQSEVTKESMCKDIMMSACLPVSE
jgi:hypothetical protein